MTSTPRLVEAIRARLAAELPPLVVEAGLPAITEFIRHSPGFIDPTRAPQVSVAMAGIRPGGPAAFGLANNAQTRNRIVLVGVTCAGEDPDEAAARLEAYVDLLYRTLEGDQTAGGEGYRVRVAHADFSPNFGQGTALYQEAILTCEVTRWAAMGAD